MIFVDTGAWFAQVMPDDPDHATAMAWLEQNKQPLITTDYVVDETLTLLKARGQYARAVAVGQQFFEGTLAMVHHMTEGEVWLAWQTFVQFSDKEWSFTDCASKVIMERLNITHVFAFDQHFRQFGSVTVVP